MTGIQYAKKDNYILLQLLHDAKVEHLLESEKIHPTNGYSLYDTLLAIQNDLLQNIISLKRRFY